MPTQPQNNNSDVALGEVLFEFVTIANAIQVNAVDVDSGVEVSIQGPISSAQADLEALAIQKLKYVLKQHSKVAKREEKKNSGGKGLIV